jgi:hypothetical protein
MRDATWKVRVKGEAQEVPVDEAFASTSQGFLTIIHKCR